MGGTLFPTDTRSFGALTLPLRPCTVSDAGAPWYRLVEEGRAGRAPAVLDRPRPTLRTVPRCRSPLPVPAPPPPPPRPRQLPGARYARRIPTAIRRSPG